MKNKILFLGLALGMISLASCTSNNEVTPKNTIDEKPTMTFTATRGNVEDSTRTMLQNGTKLVWTDGDEIAVNGEKFTVSSISADGQTATFTGPIVTAPYYACYPYSSFDSIYVDSDGIKQIHISFPENQTYKENSVGVGAFPMMAENQTTQTLQFSNYEGILKINLKGTKRISRIIIEAIAPSGGYYTWGSNTSTPWHGKANLDCSHENGGGVQLNASDATTFMIVLPANCDFNDTPLTFTFCDTEGNAMSKKMKGRLYANRFLNMPELTYTVNEYQVAGKHEIYQTHTKGKGIDIFISDDGYTKAQNEDASIVKARFIKLAEGFFYLSPLKELRDYFNVHFVYAESNSEYTDDNTKTSSNTIFGIYQDGAFSMSLVSRSKCLNFIWNSTSIDPTGKVTIIDVNRKTYGRSATYWLGDNTSIAMCYNKEDANYIVSHEASGHGFGKLADEYIEKAETYTGSGFESSHAINWIMNVDNENDPNKIVWAKFLQDTRYNDENLGVYEGAYYYKYGVYRPALNSIMVGSLSAGFNTPSREAIYKWVMSQAFDNWTYNYETFVTFDMARSRSIPHATRSTNYVEINPSERTAPPTFIKGSWKDYRDK